jgi:hypothetical protein
MLQMAPEQLDPLLAPVALYPDDLLGDVLVVSKSNGSSRMCVDSRPARYDERRPGFAEAKEHSSWAKEGWLKLCLDA